MMGKLPNTDKELQLKNSGKRSPRLNELRKMEGGKCTRVRLPIHRDQYDVTDSSWVSIRF
jgi:hypothetical protein